MARRRRYHLPGATYHVILRGNGGERIFFRDEDCCRMCLLIQEGIERYGHRLLGYCFMTNHLHLAIQVNQVNLSRIMQNIAFRYARYVNKEHNRIGHLFQGRFKSILVESNRYLKELIRYIHLNPVRAGMVVNPEDYRWSSHNTYLGTDSLLWITRDYLLHRFSNIESTAIEMFQNYVKAAIGIPEEIDFKRGIEDGILGDDNFVSMVKEKAELMPEISLSIPELTKAMCDLYEVNISSIKRTDKTRNLTKIRGILALMVRETEELTLEELGRYLSRDANGLSRQASRLDARRLHDDVLLQEIESTRIYLTQMSECPA